jgi:hypothetical protein
VVLGLAGLLFVFVREKREEVRVVEHPLALRAKLSNARVRPVLRLPLDALEVDRVRRLVVVLRVARLWREPAAKRRVEKSLLAAVAAAVVVVARAVENVQHREAALGFRRRESRSTRRGRRQGGSVSGADGSRRHRFRDERLRGGGGVEPRARVVVPRRPGPLWRTAASRAGEG